MRQIAGWPNQEVNRMTEKKSGPSIQRRRAVPRCRRRLVAEREAGFFGDQVGRTGSATCDQSNGGEAITWFPAAKRAGVSYVPEQHDPPCRAECIGEVDASDGDGDAAPVCERNLGAKGLQSRSGSCCVPTLPAPAAPPEHQTRIH